VGRADEERNRATLRARDAMDAAYDRELGVAELARLACCSPSHFIRTFKDTFGETPHRYLQRRRVERAMHLLRTTSLPVTEVCWAVGFASLGTFTRTFARVVGETPTAYRGRGPLPAVPSCFAMAWLRPSTFAPRPAQESSFGEAVRAAAG
jgi:AraC-like DNA-binding protein